MQFIQLHFVTLSIKQLTHSFGTSVQIISEKLCENLKIANRNCDRLNVVESKCDEFLAFFTYEKQL